MQCSLLHVRFATLVEHFLDNRSKHDSKIPTVLAYYGALVLKAPTVWDGISAKVAKNTDQTEK